MLFQSKIKSFKNEGMSFRVQKINACGAGNLPDFDHYILVKFVKLLTVI